MKRFYRFTQRFLQASIPRLWKVHYEGLEHVPAHGGVLIVSNHQSVLDPVLLSLKLSRECHFMARDSLFRNPAFRRLILRLNAFPVRRGTADRTAITEAVERLRAGNALVTFPEGTRSVDGRVGQALPGAVGIARRAGATVIPAVLEGLVELWPRDRRWPRRGRCWVQFGAALPIPERAGRVAAEELTVLLRGMHNRLRRRVGREAFDYNDSRSEEGMEEKASHEGNGGSEQA